MKSERNENELRGIKMMWCEGLDPVEWEEKHAYDEVDYLHGHCDEWVLENYQEGDIPVIWNEYNEDMGKVVLIHCYIIRNGKYLDIRGETDDIEDIEDGFDYGYDNGKYQCADLEEYKRMIRMICHYRSKKWK